MLFSNLLLEMNLQILGRMNLETIFKLMSVSKKFYFFLKQEIFPKIYPYFDFSNEPIRYLHCAIMYEKREIIKWLMGHNIYSHEKSRIDNSF